MHAAAPLIYAIRERPLGHRVAWLDDAGHVHSEDRVTSVAATRREFNAAGVVEIGAGAPLKAIIVRLPRELLDKVVMAGLTELAEEVLDEMRADHARGASAKPSKIS
jgi:hypothetical protein